jgi:hypothetical protein
MSGGHTEWGRDRTLVIRELDAIVAELGSGSSLKLAYESRAERLRVTYRAFARLVRKYVGDPMKDKADAATQPRTAATPDRHALTRRAFARHASLIAAYASTRADGSVALVEDTDKPFLSEALAHFVGRIRDTLDGLEARTR